MMTLRMEVRECGVNIKWGEKKKQNKMRVIEMMIYFINKENTTG